MPLRTFPGRSAKHSPPAFPKALLPPPHSCPALVCRAAGRAVWETCSPILGAGSGVCIWSPGAWSLGLRPGSGILNLGSPEWSLILGSGLQLLKLRFRS